MTDLIDIRARLEKAGWFQTPGAYVLVDGQYGSTGKGAIAALLGAEFCAQVNVVTTNAGPNSGHTGYYAKCRPGTDEHDWVKVLTQQLPVFAIVANHFGGRVASYLNGGAVIKPQTLLEEIKRYGTDRPWVHPNAAIIDYHHETDGADSTDRIASTNKGVGRAIARKVMREDNVAKSRAQDFGGLVVLAPWTWNWGKDVVFVEVAQGFSLGINQLFYPFVTSRECTVQQAIADANIPYNKVRKVIMAVRSYPIRVGNTTVGTSGDCYPDQQETTWGAIGQEPELTTVTKRVRRVFTWSDLQFRAAVRANQPDVLFVNFLNYLAPDARGAFIGRLLGSYRDEMNRDPDAVIGGYGPYPTDARLEA